MKAKLYALLVLTLVSTACSGERTGGQATYIGGESVSEAHSYEFSYNGCSTGQKDFPSNDEMCWVIQSESQNRFCAENLRAEFYRANCSGSFTPRA